MDENGEVKRTKFRKQEVAIAYEHINHTKLYFPNAPKGYKFRYVGNKPKDFVFGHCQIINDLWRTKNSNRQILVITGGEKDVLTLASLGYDAICLNSETVTTLPEVINENLWDMYQQVVVMYDLDDTGMKCSWELANKYGFKRCLLPEELKTKGGKDVSDYIRAGLSIDILKECIKNAQYVTIEDKDFVIKNVTEQNKVLDSENQTSDEFDYIPQEAFDLLPSFLKEITDEFTDTRDRDIVLLSCIAVLSTCFPNSKGQYNRKTQGANLNIFISAPSSAGKGAMDWSLKLLMPIHNKLKEEYELAKETYRLMKEENPKLDKSFEPSPKYLIIPANSSAACVYDYLTYNKNFGLIFDTEADTLADTKNNAWSDFSDLTRKAFEHERLSKARVNGGYMEVNHPHLSTVLSGTRNQIKNLINSVENGLFSRYLFYDFDARPIWRDMFGDGDNSLELLFARKADELLAYWDYGFKLTTPTYFLLDEKQREEIFNYFQQHYQELYQSYGDDMMACIKRTCLMFYRVAIILESLKIYKLHAEENTALIDWQYISDESYRCALLIIDTNIKHLQKVFNIMKQNDAVSASTLNNQQQTLFAHLPVTFTTDEFNSLAKANGIGIHAAKKYIRDFLNAKLIERIAHGNYKKVENI